MDFNGNPDLQALTKGREERLPYVAQTAKDRLGLAVLLVRPDGFVAWATDAETDLAQPATITQQWFGAPGLVSDRLRENELPTPHSGENE